MMQNTTSHPDLLSLLEFDFVTAVDAVDHHGRERPTALAIEHGDSGTRLSYAELSARTDRIAGNLVRRGIQPGSRVAVLTRDPLVSVLAMFGIWKAGAVHAPVNFQYEGRLLAYQCDDTAASLMIVDQDLVPTVEAIAPQLRSRPDLVVVSGSTSSGFGGLLEPTERPQVVVGPDDPANIVYTSGTTGPSKGVVQPHRWMTQYTWVGRQLIDPTDVIYNDLPMYHVGGAVYNVVRALWVGASVSLWNRFSPSEFWARICSSGATSAVLLDVMIPWLLKAPEREDDRQNPLNKVHLQPLPRNHREFAARFGIDYVTSGFGQTESGNPLVALVRECADGQGTPPELRRGLTDAQIRAVFADHDLLDFGPRDEVPAGLMGRPTPFMEVAVLDERDLRCAPGVVGQLALRPRVPGTIVREYLGKPEATLEAFANLWFHTGDSAVCDEQGVFRFVDRMGDRIRVRGENISSFHVEELLLTHEEVALAAVFGTPSAEGDEDSIVAFVQRVEGSDLDANALAQFCRTRMPKFMRPEEIRFVDEIPRTPTNKIEKYKLRRLFEETR